MTKRIILIIYFIIQRPKSHLRGIGAHQRQGKTSEKNEEKERDRGIEGETPNPIPGNWCAHRGERVERKTDENKKKETGSGSPTQLPWTIKSPPTTGMDHTVILFSLPRLIHPKIK